jgi:hypothetical protein
MVPDATGGQTPMPHLSPPSLTAAEQRALLAGSGGRLRDRLAGDPLQA